MIGSAPEAGDRKEEGGVATTLFSSLLLATSYLGAVLFQQNKAVSLAPPPFSLALPFRSVYSISLRK